MHYVNVKNLCRKTNKDDAEPVDGNNVQIEHFFLRETSKVLLVPDATTDHQNTRCHGNQWYMLGNIPGDICDSWWRECSHQQGIDSCTP